MNPVMPRISWARGLQSLHRASSSTSRKTAAAAAARHISTTPARSSSKNTEWVRSKLWKDGDAPGAADPYTQRPDDVPEDSAVTRLPQHPALEGSDPADRRPLAVRRSRLPFPANRNEAATPKEVGATDPAYEPATSLDDLADLGTLREWWDQPGHWSAELDGFAAFASPARVTDRAAIEVYYRRALVEVLALRETGALGEWATRRWAEGSRDDLDAALAVDVVVRDGEAGTVLKGNVAAVADSLKQTPDEAAAVETPRPERISSEEAAELVKAWDPSWKRIAVDDETKFALRKRLYQLTGNLVPDAKLGAARTVGHLIVLTAKRPKAKRLAEILQRTEELQQLANVTLHDRRVSSIDKEVAVGRWKLIEEELVKRDLPVTGLADVSRNREQERLLGRI
ncbi:Ribosomal protein L50, mitochondria [Cordyceps fumosorosea ARSEF 2679]|uniref:Large ribosomal subunit protein mL50 n=1 Tax=Cordyceps fumosorosea (strain ARSEF 2679) TaxID=1081104 RepID=A0A168BXI1_CORFA|nr:Ribosomal protein L50, mitochondria [Cordyceps fumosorosea ARSEF 2679]OAA70675.1 Ribosomal protein L50, mitochondria [Cordyceps fumosorosea ARSEF 2679]